MIADIIIRGASAPAEPVTDRHGSHTGLTTVLNGCFQFCFPFRKDKNYIQYSYAILL